MHALIFKADSPHDQAKQDFKQLLETESVPMKRAFNRFVDQMLSNVSDAQINTWIQNKDLQGFLSYASDYVDEMADTIPKTMQRAAKAEIDRLQQPGTFGIGKLGIEFDPGNPVAIDMAEESRVNFIKDFTTKQKAAVQAAIDDAIKSGKGPIAAARQFRDSIGLTENQAQAVRNYQQLLENNSSQALERQLRDARFDRTVERVIENDDLLSGKQIERMVQAYARNMRNMRAETIARTETMTALNQAKQVAWSQIAEEMGIKPTKVERTWITTLDGRERDSHAEMNRQTVMGLDEPFISGDGEELMYPGDPDASAEERINCRCTLIVRFPPPKRMLGKAFDPGQPRDKDGKWTGVGYHGTASEFDEFEARAPHNKLTGKDDVKGIYFSGDQQAASGYANMRARETGSKVRRVVAANLTMKNPLDITNAIKRGQKKGLSFGDAKRAAMKDLTSEHDGVVFRGNSVNPPEYVVFHHSQIHRIAKAFNPDQPRDEDGKWTSSANIGNRTLYHYGKTEPVISTKMRLIPRSISTTDDQDAFDRYGSNLNRYDIELHPNVTAMQVDRAKLDPERRVGEDIYNAAVAGGHKVVHLYGNNGPHEFAVLDTSAIKGIKLHKPRD